MVGIGKAHIQGAGCQVCPCLHVSLAAKSVCLTWWGNEPGRIPGCSCRLSKTGKGEKTLRIIT